MQAIRSTKIIATLAVTALVLTGCVGGSQRMQTTAQAAPEQVMPVQNSSVATTNLPPIGGTASVNTAGAMPPAGGTAPGLSGQPVLGGQPQLSGQPVLGGTPPATAPMQTASADPNFVTLDSVGSVPSTPGRDLSGGLTVDKLLGGWTITSGTSECRLNLTYTEKTGTSRYRASSPACTLPGLSGVASWQLAGSQVQLFDEGGTIIAALILSGNRFIGTLSGGQAISMAG
ncbi:AprI/Inh family metalloprotease inhibitor [Arsenicitalea aurantiaca]|nr:AprI/Inh family metalloprotease inhibitor [Arsenicitalea aurantiaca]